MSTYPVRVRPGASRTRVGGGYGDPPVLVVAVSAPAVDGRANVAVIRALADALGVPSREVEIVRGHTARTKMVSVRHAPDDLDERWRSLIGADA